MPEEIKLRECPFCGSNAEYIYQDYETIEDLAHGVCCKGVDSCALQFKFDSTKQAVIDIWNTRAADKTIEAMVDALRFAIPIFKDMYSMELAEPEIMQKLEAALALADSKGV